MTKYLYPPKIPIYILSPHFDDAAFSLGSFMATYARRNPINVINIFTAADTHRPTLSARAFLSQIGAEDPIQLFSDRQQEDKKALKSLGVTVSNWGAVDALWRRHSINRSIPELGANYPTYRLHVSQGKVSIYDRELIKQLKDKLLSSLPKHGDYRLIVPLGHGGHVDHVIARQLGEAIVPASQLSYYLDFPYSIRKGVRPGRPPLSHKPISLPTNLSHKRSLCELYVTQYSKVIPDPALLKTPETIFIFDTTRPMPKAGIYTHLLAFITSPKNYIFSLLSSARTVPSPLPRVWDREDKKVQVSFIKYLTKALRSVIPQGIGSVALGIAGRGDLDILIPIKVKERTQYESVLTQLLGSPSHQNSYMTQWKVKYHGRPVDLDLILEDSSRYHEQNYLFSLLESDAVLRREYEVVKLNFASATQLHQELKRIIFVDGYLLSQTLHSLPKRLGGYVLVSPLNQESVFKSDYLIGEYQDVSGKIYVAKIYAGSTLARSYRFLRNEAIAYQCLTATRLVSSPKLHFFLTNRHYSYLLLEKVLGHDLTQVEPKNRFIAIEECINFLYDQPKIKGISYRPAIYWITLIPFLFLINIYRKKLPRKVILKLAWQSVKDFIWTLFRPTALVHRDLNFQNCFVTKNGLSLIDYQLTTYADPILEYAVILLKYYPDTSLLKALTRSKRYQKLVHHAPHGLSVLKFYLTVIGLYDLLLSNGRSKVSTKILTELSNNRIKL